MKKITSSLATTFPSASSASGALRLDPRVETGGRRTGWLGIMKNALTGLASVIALATAAASCTVGAADDSTLDSAEVAREEGQEEPGEAADRAVSETKAGDRLENVAVAQQELLACTDLWHHGGNLTEQDYEKVLGCACGPGYARNSFTVWNAGHGSCYALGWASSDPNDCRVLTHIHDSGGFFYGDCNAQIEKKCDHNRCSTGCALDTDFNGCTASICAVDPYCCTTAWDSICVGEVASVCHSSC